MSGTSGFSHKYNTDDVLIRAIIVGLINSLNEQIYIENVLSDTERKKVSVPFFYAFSGDERFLQDYFSNWSDCYPNFIEGNYDPIPRGSVQLTGINVAASNMTSRFVRGFYVKEEKGELLRYNSYLNSIPLNMSFKVDLIVDTSIDSFKIVQQIIKTFYKTLVFRINFGGTVVPSQAGFSETYTVNKLFEYTYGENSRITISFELEVESYYPIFDSSQEMFAGSRIQYVQPTVSLTAPNRSVTESNSTIEENRIVKENKIVNDGTIGINNISNSNAGVPDSSSTSEKGNILKKDSDRFGENYWE